MLQLHVRILLPKIVSMAKLCICQSCCEWCSPSPRFFSERDFLRVIGSGRSASASSSCCSSGSFVSFSGWVRGTPRLGLIAPFVFDFASSSETGCEIESLCLDIADGDGEPVRGRLMAGLLLFTSALFFSFCFLLSKN
jgi:hypothetical protein